jgi:DNA-binding transcriptional MerR regulator
MREAELRVPGEVAQELGISTSTLRRWAKEFDTYLSKTAGMPSRTGAGAPAHRRYTQADVSFLARVKGMLDQGLTYGQVIQHLRGEAPSARDELREEESYPIVTSQAEMEAPALGRSFVFVADALRNVGENQQAIQNSLQVNRNLLGVLIQDNFNLKEENTKLRDRVLKLEQAVNQLGQEREAPPLSRKQLTELESRKGCLGSVSQ